MEILKKYKWLFFAIVGNLFFLYADLLTYGKFRISLLTIIFGYTPLFILIVKAVRQNRIYNQEFLEAVWKSWGCLNCCNAHHLLRLSALLLVALRSTVGQCCPSASLWAENLFSAFIEEKVLEAQGWRRVCDLWLKGDIF